MSQHAKFEVKRAVTLVVIAKEQVFGTFRNMSVVKNDYLWGSHKKFGAETPTNYTFPVTLDHYL